MKTHLFALITFLVVSAQAQEVEVQAPAPAPPIIDLSDVSVRTVCQKLLGHMKIVSGLGSRSQMDQIVGSYGGLQFLWAKGDGQNYEGSGAAFGARFTKEQQDFRKTALSKLKVGLNQLAIQPGLILDPKVQGEARAKQIGIMSMAYELMNLDPKLYGLTFPERVKVRVAAATLLNEMGLHWENFVFDPLKNPVGRRIYLSGESVGHDTYLELMNLAGNKPFNTWGNWRSSGKIASSNSEILWLLDKKDYQKPGDLNVFQIRVARNHVGEFPHALPVSLRQPDGSWLPLLFDVNKDKQLIPIKTIKGESVEQFCVRCHTEMKAGKMAPEFNVNR